jgi:hypothetical protein
VVGVGAGRVERRDDERALRRGARPAACAPHVRRARAGIIDRPQFSLRVTVVVASAIVPTAVAQRWFAPHVSPARA